jgi:hypothetical protein
VNQLVAGMTDLVFGLVMSGCAIAVSRVNRAQFFGFQHRYWPATYWLGAASAFIGVTHHLVFAHPQVAADLSWIAVGVALCLSLSALLAATAVETLSAPAARTVIRIRSVGLVGYAVFAATGRGNLGALLACESLTMLAVISLWLIGARDGHPQAPRILAGMFAMAAATLAFTPPGLALGDWLRLDPGSFEHLLQIPGMMLLARGLVLDPPSGRVRRVAYASGES